LFVGLIFIIKSIQDAAHIQSWEKRCNQERNEIQRAKKASRSAAIRAKLLEMGWSDNELVLLPLTFDRI
jgi:hypothetical protein